MHVQYKDQYVINVCECNKKRPIRYKSTCKKKKNIVCKALARFENKAKTFKMLTLRNCQELLHNTPSKQLEKKKFHKNTHDRVGIGFICPIEK